MTGLRYHNSKVSQTGPGYSHAVLDGGYAFLSGQLAADATDPAMPRGDIESETRACLELLGAILREIGLGFDDVVRVNVHMTELGEFDVMNRVYETFFTPGRLPARTTVGVASLLFGCRIEIDCIARLKTTQR